MKLFQVNSIICFKFHIHHRLSENKQKEYSSKIIQNGGYVVPLPGDDVITLTTRKFYDGFSEAYDIKFIDDCLESEKILDIGKYSLERGHNHGCAMSLLLFGEKKCHIIEVLRQHSVTDTSPPTSAERVDPVEDYQILRGTEPAEIIKTPQKKRQAEVLENALTPKKNRRVLSLPVLETLEKKGVSIVKASEKRNQEDTDPEENSNLEMVENKREMKREKTNLSLYVKDKGEIKKKSRRKESERMDEDEDESQEVDINALVKQLTLGKKEKERRKELERIEEENKEQERRKELERIEEDWKEQKRKEELARKEQARKEQERREESKRIEENIEQEIREALARKQGKKEQEKREKEIREEMYRKEVERLNRLEQETMERLERKKREAMEELKKKEQELREAEKKFQERIEQEKKTQERKEKESRKQEESTKTNKKYAPLITKIVKVVLNRTNDSPNSGNSSPKSKSQEESTPGKRCLSSPHCEENFPERKRVRNEDTIENQILSLRPFTQVPSDLTQNSEKDSNEAVFGSYEYQHEEESINQGQYIDDSENSENSLFPRVLTQLPMEDSNVGETQNVLDSLDSTVESLENGMQKLSGQEKIQESQEKIQEIQERIEESQEKIREIQEKIQECQNKNQQSQNKKKRWENSMTSEEESGPLLDDVSKAALLEDDSVTDFESATDTSPTTNRNPDPDLIIIKHEISVDKITYENVGTEGQGNTEQSPMENMNLKVEIKASSGEKDKALENNEDDDDDDISDADTIRLSNLELLVRPNLIRKYPEEKKEERLRKEKGKLAGLKTFLYGDNEEQDDSFEEPRKEVMEKNKNEEKENLEKSVQSRKERPKSRWSSLFS